MTDLAPVAGLDPVIQIETGTLVLGGTGNPANQQAQALLNRDAFRAQQIADGVSATSLVADDLAALSIPVNQSDLSNTRTVESFGAAGDGVTNDTPALHGAFAWLQAAPGRTLVFGAGLTYIQGPGAVEVIYETNPYFPARFNLVDQSDMKIIGNGARIEADTTLTDTQFNRGFQFLRCNNLSIWSLEYDGRLDARTPFGGDAFNGGNELTGNIKQGFEFVRCYDAVLYRVKATRCMMDGFTPTYEFGFPGVDSESKRLWVIDCEATYNYRQGMSIIGASFCRIDGGQYSHTGSLGVGKGTNPMAGIDIEANEDNEFKRCAHNTIVGAELRDNRQGLAFAFGAQYNRAINCKAIENRLYGTSFALTGCEGNTWEGGQIVQTQATTESATRAATIGRNRNGLVNTHIQIATPHRGVDFENSTTCTDCFVYDSLVEDVAPATDVTALPFLLNTFTNNMRPIVKGNTFLNGTGTGHMVNLDCATGDFLNNKINSVHGVAGARGLTAIKAGNVHGNSGAGTRIDTAAQNAVFNIAGSATLIKQMGPNLDEENPRIGAQTRRLGFSAPPFYGSVAYDPPSLADGAGATTTVTVTGAALGDFATAAFSNSVAGLTVTANVTAANTVTVRFQNESGVLIDVASGTLSVKVTN